MLKKGKYGKTGLKKDPFIVFKFDPCGWLITK